MSDGYNGWTNWETWNAKLWLDNGDLCDPFEIQEQGRYCAETYGDNAAGEMAEWLWNQVDEHLRFADGERYHATGLGADLLTSAVERINWKEIGEAYCEEARENEREQTANANA